MELLTHESWHSKAPMAAWPVNFLSGNPISMLQIIGIHDLDSEFDRNNTDWLSDGEKCRYQSINAANRKQQYIAGHYLVRKMAARILGNAAQDWDYVEDSHGLRLLKSRREGLPAPYLSISHSGEWVVAGLSLFPIGVDIENCHTDRDFIAIAEHVFSPLEVEILKACKAADLKSTFYLYWTLKECLAKQSGIGLRFDVSRSQSAIPEPNVESSSLRSWQCSDFVIAAACQPNTTFEASGLCNDVKLQAWSASSSISVDVRQSI